MKRIFILLIPLLLTQYSYSKEHYYLTVDVTKFHEGSLKDTEIGEDNIVNSMGIRPDFQLRIIKDQNYIPKDTRNKTFQMSQLLIKKETELPLSENLTVTSSPLLSLDNFYTKFGKYETLKLKKDVKNFCLVLTETDSRIVGGYLIPVVLDVNNVVIRHECFNVDNILGEKNSGEVSFQYFNQKKEVFVIEKDSKLVEELPTLGGKVIIYRN